MFNDAVTDATQKQWVLAKRLGISYPAGLSPEDAHVQGFITNDQFTSIKSHLPDFVSMTDLINYNVVSPTLDVVGQPIVAGLTAMRNLSTTIMLGFGAVVGLILVTRSKR